MINFYNGGLWGNFVFRRIKLKFCSWLYKKRSDTSWKFQLEITSNKKVIAKKPLTNLYEMNSTSKTFWGICFQMCFISNFAKSDWFHQKARNWLFTVGTCTYSYYSSIYSYYTCMWDIRNLWSYDITLNVSRVIDIRSMSSVLFLVCLIEYGFYFDLMN